MTSKVKNIIIFVAVGIALVLIYIFFIKKGPEENALISTSPIEAVPSANVSNQNISINQDFLSLLLNVKNIKLNTAIFSDLAFTSLHDSSIVLVPDGTEGRPNPFAPIGSDNLAPPPPLINNINNPPIAPN